MRALEVPVRIHHGAIVLAISALSAQSAKSAAAPGIDTITQADLRADLFFLAGDAMRGRLTDTNENRVTIDYIRSRFERAGLKPAANVAYFQTYNLMSATLGEGNSLEVSPGSGVDPRVQERTGLLSAAVQRQRHVTAPVAFAGSASRRRRWNHDDYKGDVKGKVVLVLDHEPGERDPKSPFEGVVTPEPAAAVAQGAGGAAKRRGRASCSSATCTITRAGQLRTGGAKLLAEAPARIPNYTLATWTDRIHIPVAQIAGTGRVAHRRHRQDARRIWRSRRRPRAASRRWCCRTCAIDLHTSPSIATPCPIATCSACSRAAIPS